MSTSVNALEIRKKLGRNEWRIPQKYDVDGWCFVRKTEDASIIVSVASFDDIEWIHASIACTDHMPSYDELALLHKAVFGERFAYQVFAPSAQHVNIHQYALHLWGRLDGNPVLPEFGLGGTI
jgi:hypothetical protein